MNVRAPCATLGAANRVAARGAAVAVPASSTTASISGTAMRGRLIECDDRTLFPGGVAVPLDGLLDPLGGHREPERERARGETVVTCGHDLEVQVRCRRETGITR